MFDFDDEDRENPVGSLFRYHRLQRKLDLERVSEDLRIKQDYLEAIEQGRFDLLPTGIYRRSFVKAYAEYLKLDSSHVLTMLDQLEKAPGKPTREHPPSPKPHEPEAAEEPKPIEMKPATPSYVRREPRTAGEGIGYGASIFLGLLVGALCVIFLFQIGAGKRRNLSVSQIPTQAESLAVIPEPPDTMQLFLDLLDRKIRSAPELIVRIQAEGRSWIQIFSDGVEVYTGFINENMSAEFKAKQELSINLGANQGIKAFLNGFKLIPLEKGITRIDRQNFSAFILTDRANDIVRARESQPRDTASKH